MRILWQGNTLAGSICLVLPRACNAGREYLQHCMHGGPTLRLGGLERLGLRGPTRRGSSLGSRGSKESYGGKNKYIFMRTVRTIY